MRNIRYRLIGLIMLVLLVMAAPGLNGGTVNAQATGGVNWVAQFYNSIDFTLGTEVGGVVSYPAGLNFVWAGQPTDANGIPVAGVPADNFSVEFLSFQTFAQSGIYTFTVTADDQVVVLIDSVTAFIQTVPGTYTFTYNLAAGQHQINVGLIELTQDAKITLVWEFGDTGGVPTGPTGPTGNVVQVRGLSLRTGPYLGASFIGVLRPDIAYPVLARSNDEGGLYTWYKVQAGEKVGWSSGRYLNINGDVNSIPFEGTVFEQIANPPDIGAIAIPRAIMNLRLRPSQRSFRLDQVPWGDQVELLGRTLQGGMNHWLQVRYNGQVGWIYAPFVTVRGNVGAVPIY